MQQKGISALRPAAHLNPDGGSGLSLPVDLADALAMARGYKAGLTLANQSPHQLPADVRSAAFGQARSKVVLQMGAHDAAVMARELGEPLTPTDIVHLGRYEAYARLVVDNQQSSAFSLRTRPLPPALSDPDDIRRRSRERFGLRRVEVEQAIRDRLTPPTPPGEVGKRRRAS